MRVVISQGARCCGSRDAKVMSGPLSRIELANTTGKSSAHCAPRVSIALAEDVLSS